MLEGRRVDVIENRNPLPTAAIAALISSAFISAILTVSPSSSYAAPSNPNWKVVFESNRDGDSEIYVVDALGRDEIRLTDNNAVDRDPSWSPDGKKIAFVSSRQSARYDIYVMDANGANVTRLTSSAAIESDPSWSPDGKRIAFASLRGVHVMNSDGTGLVKLPNNLSGGYPSWSPDGTKIAFASPGNGSHAQVYVMDANGSDPVRLTDNAYPSDQPRWSPDGTKIVFTSAGSGGADIYVMDADGSNKVRVTNSVGVNEAEPGWSPDGKSIVFASNTERGKPHIRVVDADGRGEIGLTSNAGSNSSPEFQPFPFEIDIEVVPAIRNFKVAFVSDRVGGQDEIYVMNSDGTNQSRLPIKKGVDFQPDWSPNGTKIAFASLRDGNQEIYVMNANGTREERLTKSATQDAFPSWSPDGKRIAFTNGDGSHSDIYVMDPDGKNQKRLASNAAIDSKLGWSPNGTKIAFTGTRDDNYDITRIDNYEIYVMNATGDHLDNLTNNPATDTHPSWSPDGKKIAFASDRTGNFEIYVMNSSGSHPVRLTNNPASDSYPCWSPDGARIMFVSTRHDNDGEIFVMDADGTDVEQLTRNRYSNSEPDFGPLILPQQASQNATSPATGGNPATGPLAMAISQVRIFHYNENVLDYRPENETAAAVVGVNDPIVVNSLITNQFHQAEHFDYVVQVVDSRGVTVAISVRHGVAVPLGHSIPVDSGAMALDKAGTFTVKVLVVRNLDGNPSVLSLAAAVSITVA